MSIDEIESKLKDLRKEWAGKLGQDREILIRRARALEIAREKLLSKPGQKVLFK